MVAEGRLAEIGADHLADLRAVELGIFRERGHDRQAHGVGQRVQHVGDVDVVHGRLGKVTHTTMVPQLHSSTSIEHTVAVDIDLSVLDDETSLQETADLIEHVPDVNAQPAADLNRWRSLPLILAAVFMGLFDVFVVNVAAPSIRGDLHVGDGGLELVVAGYSFTYAAGLVTGGRLGDLFGRRRLFLLGMSLFTVASLLCGIAPGEGILIGGRLLQGVGASLMVPQVLAIMTTSFLPEERTRAFSYFGLTVGLGAASGQILGGVILNANIFGLQWRPVFLVNVPIGIIAVLGARKLVRESRSTVAEPIDPIGLLLLVFGLGAVLVPLVLGRSEGWPIWTYLLLAASVPLLAGFALWELRVDRTGGAPMLRLSLLSSRAVITGLSINLGYFAFFGSFLYSLTLFLQVGLHNSPLRAGLTFAPLGVAFMAASILGRPFVTRYGSRVVTVGAVISLIGLVGLVLTLRHTGLHTTTLDVGPWAGLCGIGNGLVVPSLVASVLAGVPGNQAGSVSGALTTTQQFANALGVAAVGVVFYDRLASHGIVSAMTAAVFVDVVLVAISLVLTFFLPRPKGLIASVPVEA